VKAHPGALDCRRSSIEEQTLAAGVIVPISDASVEIRIGTNGAYAFGSREIYRMSDSAGRR
jgi:hypothetical protein